MSRFRFTLGSLALLLLYVSVVAGILAYARPLLADRSGYGVPCFVTLAAFLVGVAAVLWVVPLASKSGRRDERHGGQKNPK